MKNLRKIHYHALTSHCMSNILLNMSSSSFFVLRSALVFVTTIHLSSITTISGFVLLKMTSFHIYLLTFSGNGYLQWLFSQLLHIWTKLFPLFIFWCSLFSIFFGWYCLNNELKNVLLFLNNKITFGWYCLNNELENLLLFLKYAWNNNKKIHNCFG